MFNITLIQFFYIYITDVEKRNKTFNIEWSLDNSTKFYSLF